MNKEYIDIKKWSNPPLKFFDHLKDEFKDRDKTYVYDLRDLKVDHVKIYCLLKYAISDQPNGFYTMLMHDKPIGNIFWWDFLLDSELGFIHFYRSQSKIELMTNVELSLNDVKEFISFNLSKYSKEIDEVKKSLEIHKLYVNHYHSYTKCVVELKKQLESLDVSPTNAENKIEQNPKLLQSTLTKFIDDNIKFHSVGKSLLLNSAFLVEAYINLLIRVSAKSELKDYPDILKKHLNSNFKDKLKNLKYYSVILSKDVDTSNQIIVDVLKVIQYRNKYVHSDLSSKLNEIGEVHFDEYFPVFKSYKHSPIIENIVRIYQNPTEDIVNFCYITSLKFIKYIESHFKENDMARYIRMIMNQNPIGYNVDSKNYSAIFSNLLFDARFGSKEKTDNT